MVASNAVLVVVARKDTRDRIRTQLESAGYELLAVSTTDEAYALLKRKKNIALLLTDVTASGTIDAIELVSRAKALYPDLRILFTTDLDRFTRRPEQGAGSAHSTMIMILGTLLEDS